MDTSKKADARVMKHLTDEELMRIVQSGDLSPIDEIYDRYAKRLYNFAFQFLWNRETAQDAVQEVFMKLVKNAKQYNVHAKFSTWLYSITRNWCRDYLRVRINQPTESDDVLVAMPGPEVESPHRRLEAREDLERLKKVLAKLEPDDCEVILLMKYHGFSQAEIAQIACCSETAVKLRVFRAMKALKEALAGMASGGDECLNAMS